MAFKIAVPDYGDSGQLYQYLDIPDPSEAGYKSPAQRMAEARPGDPWGPIIAREQAITEYLDGWRGPEPEAGG